MKNLLFVSRVAFIANVCMLLSFLMRYVEVVKDRDMQSTIIIAGFLLSSFFNLMAAISLLVLIFQRRSSLIRPRWLFVANLLCFIFQLYLLFK